MPERTAGVEFHSEMFNSEESVFPKSLYGRLSWMLGPYHFDIFEVQYNFQSFSLPFKKNLLSLIVGDLW